MGAPNPTNGRSSGARGKNEVGRHGWADGRTAGRRVRCGARASAASDLATPMPTSFWCLILPEVLVNDKVVLAKKINKNLCTRTIKVTNYSSMNKQQSKHPTPIGLEHDDVWPLHLAGPAVDLLVGAIRQVLLPRRGGKVAPLVQHRCGFGYERWRSRIVLRGVLQQPGTRQFPNGGAVVRRPLTPTAEIAGGDSRRIGE